MSLLDHIPGPLYEEPFYDAYYTLRDIVENVYQYTPQPGHKVLDLGAHKGWFSVYCASRGALVYAYEPDVYNFEAILKIPLPSIIPFNRGVWSRACDLRFYPSPVNSGNGSFVTKDREISYMLPVVAFSEALGKKSLWDCVKMDIEGSEYEAIMSTSDQDFDRIMYMAVEIHNSVLSQSQHDGIMAKLRAKFTVKVVNEDSGRTNYAYCWKV